ncbi:hypothetical protein N9V27_01180 [bacterium]|nr:hypothetical protein [bacterium]
MYTKKKTQRLFYKKWPYKVLIKVDHAENRKRADGIELLTAYSPRMTKDREETYQFKSKFKRWFKRHIPNGGIRCERTISLFLCTQKEVDFIIDTWKHNIEEVYAPESEEAMTLLQDNVYDIVREHDWYRKYPVRARILYTREFASNGRQALEESLKQIEQDDWHCQGTLMSALESGGNLPYACGQPYYLYLKSNDDAVILRLTCGDYIERFERIRKP